MIAVIQIIKRLSLSKLRTETEIATEKETASEIEIATGIEIAIEKETATGIEIATEIGEVTATGIGIDETEIVVVAGKEIETETEIDDTERSLPSLGSLLMFKSATYMYPRHSMLVMLKCGLRL